MKYTLRIFNVDILFKGSLSSTMCKIHDYLLTGRIERKEIFYNIRNNSSLYNKNMIFKYVMDMDICDMLINTGNSTHKINIIITAVYLSHVQITYQNNQQILFAVITIINVLLKIHKFFILSKHLEQIIYE
ncbi:hypothetical protein AK88_03553 [Plasmodium fragile]|uniref:Uncharacterized protein n=1 Tax=Plasmodium fragile TaxID=5857 RepID=A0A0D9QII4_PLAFR|nr:uncharacterized protein AK88_03553 [Plasmodium fragile]KJP86844.1 hypothetical protein AK88_03553 [Plasmodium fragile]